MARLTILTPKKLQTVYALPQFTDEKRDTYFSLDLWEKQTLDEFHSFIWAFRVTRLFYLLGAFLKNTHYLTILQLELTVPVKNVICS